jgi:hypothetical protein
MRYFGGGISHMDTQTQLSNEDDAMDVDEAATVDNGLNHNAGEDLGLQDVHLLEELCQMASNMVEGDVVGDREEAVEHENDDLVDSNQDEGDKDDNPCDSPPGEVGSDNDDLGPEDGEGEGSFDTGYSAL